MMPLRGQAARSAPGPGQLDGAIAIIGLSCRLPAAPEPRSFWRMLRDGVHGITEVPDGRPDAAALLAEGIRYGAFLSGVEEFDPEFFGIAPREAASMDPQQRLMLELAWEALEDASIPPTTLRGTPVGVFVGAISDDYAILARRVGDQAITHYTMTGTHRAIIANRISYLLGLTGPSLIVDSAQSSSLVSVQLACESLRRGEGALALAGGVSLALAAEPAVSAARIGALSPDGRCYVFDSRANGYVRGEGGGLVVLKPLAAALRDGDPVRGVILGEAVNNDGGGDGLTVPSQAAQENLLRAACQRAGVAPSAIQYVELHGTGTPVGDPIEAAALGGALGGGRPAGDPLLVGSAKTNVGHLEGAAGIVGLLKVVLSVCHRQLPASLNFETSNPSIPQRALGLRVQTRTGPWPHPERPLIAGVSSFGMGGTNCHVLVSEPPPAARPPRTGTPVTEGTALPWVISGRSPEALAGQAAALRDWLADSTADLDFAVPSASVAAGLVRSRPAFAHRAVLVTSGAELPGGALDALARGDLPPGAVRGAQVVTGGCVGEHRHCVFVFPGQGTQWAGMGAELLDTSTVFAARMAECQEALAPFIDWSVTDLVRGAAGAPGLDREDLVQPALFAVMVSIAALWRSLGVEPAAVVGHSQGEVAAACVAGALTLPQAAKIIAVRSRLQAELRGRGGMASVPLPAADVVRRLAPWNAELGVAAVNSPRSTVVSGGTAALTAFIAQCQAAGVTARRIAADCAGHSQQMDIVRDRLLAELADIKPGPTDIPIYSTVTGGQTDPERLGPEYWYRNLREPVRFDRAVGALLDDGYRSLLEISPHPSLVAAAQDVADAAAVEIAVGCSLRRDQGGWEQLLKSAAELYVLGVTVDWSRLFTGPRGYAADLPPQAFQRRRYWLDAFPADEPLAALPALSARADRGALLELIQAHAAAILGHENTEAVVADRTFKDLGFDSITSLELSNRLGAATGQRLPAALLYHHPTPAALTDHLLAAPPGAGQASVNRPEPDDPVVIVAMACHYPGGADSPEDLWRLVAGEVDATGDFPDSRGWDAQAWFSADPDTDAGAGSRERAYTRRGGFLPAADKFDAAFFGISPREALAMDPQQRLLLETSWEALERASIVPGDLAGTQTAVYAGVMAQDYGPRLYQEAGESGGYLLTGNTASVASGRIAYTLGLQGPAVTVDTACSSSLVALHLAVRALRAGECDLALVGGAAVLATPGLLVEFSRQQALSPDGRCKAFAAAADGTAWAEGAGVLVLERRSDAVRHGRPALAILRGTAINSDGASNGLTAPSGPAQERVIRLALADAGLRPSEVDAVEAHGTGTRLGDPIEADALIATYGQDRPPGRPLWLGSIKSNIGHTQAAAGIAGVIKMVECMRHGRLPRTLHVDALTPHVDWPEGAVAVLTSAVSWPDTGRPYRAAVSSFGISGTNAHVILEHVDADPEERPADPDSETSPVPWVLSAVSEDALPAQAGRLAAHLAAHPGAAPADVGYSLATTRTHHKFRASVTGQGSAELLAKLERLASGEDDRNLIRGSGQGKVAFVFPGQGAQWAGMAGELIEYSTAFREHLHACADALAPHTDWNLLDVLQAGPSGPELAFVDVIQPTLFAMMTGLAVLWRHYGVDPDAVTGHSQGEIAAAWAAGALSLDDAALVVARRSQALTAVSGLGGMAAVSRPADQVTSLIAPWGDHLTIASFNGPASTVVSGDAEPLEELLAACRRERVHARRVATDCAGHSPHIDRVRDTLLEAIAGLTPRPSETDLYSTVTGEVIGSTALDADYWYRNMRMPVRYEQVTRLLLRQGYRLLIELSPHPVLTVATQETIDEAGVAAHAMGTLRRDDGGPGRMLTSVAEAHVHGAAPNWETVFASQAPSRVALPTYAFRRESYWLRPSTMTRDLSADWTGVNDHPILDRSLPLAGGQVVFTGRISLVTHPWLADHAVHGQVVLPGTALLDLALFAARTTGTEGLAELTLHSPVLLPSPGTLALQVYLATPDEAGNRTLTIDSRPADEPAGDGDWTRHATGTLEPAATASTPPPVSWPAAGEPIEPAALEYELAARGYDYGPTFLGLTGAVQEDDQLYVRAEPTGDRSAADSRFVLSPALLDAALHPLLGSLSGGQERVLLPFAFTGVRLWGTAAGGLRARLTLVGGDRAALMVTGDDGSPVLTAESLAFRELVPGALGPSAPVRHRMLFEIGWITADPGGPPVASGPVAVVSDGPDLAEALTAAGLRAIHYRDLAALRSAPDGQPALVLAPVTPGGASVAAVHATVANALILLQQWLDDERHSQQTLVIVTRGAVSTEASEVVGDLAGAAVWGLVRSAQSENPGRLVLADLDDRSSSAAALIPAVTAAQPQLAVRDAVVKVPRLAPYPVTEALPAERQWRIDISGRGTLDCLEPVDNGTAARPLAPGEVRVAVRAAGLNFHDLVLTLGLVDDDGGVGLEGAGVIEQVGEAVTDLRPGDRVMGLFPGAFGQVAVADRRLLARIPGRWTFAQAASVPAAFLTAWFALGDLGRLRAGERLLVHSAAGGVGMAAGQLARHLGAQVFGTASPGKWPVLREAGFADEQIASSRTLEFEARFRRATGGQGMDVVLHSLEGEFTDASLRLLAPGGRFVDIGKTDVREAAEVARAHPGTYHPFDLLRVSPDHVAGALADLLALFEAEALSPLPVTAFDVRHARDAFRHLREARHTGKIVLTVPAPIDSDGTVLITGGTGTLGALAARHLVSAAGVRHLLLASRRGPDAAGSAALIAELQSAGATAAVVRCDLADRDEVTKLLDSVPANHPLTAVIHAAGELDDGVIGSLTPERLETTLGPKADGAWHLHELTRDRDLSAFVLYSSAAGLLGLPGQGNYAAANTFLDALACHRRSNGLPATSLAWGLWAPASGMTGHLERSEKSRMARAGIAPLTAPEGLALLDDGLTLDQPLAAALRLAGGAPRWDDDTVPALLRGLSRPAPHRPENAAVPAPSPILDRISAVTEGDRRRLLREFVCDIAAVVLGRRPDERPGPDESFKHLGYDSLTAVELRNRIAANTGLRLPATLVFDYPTPAELAAYLSATLGRAEDSGQPSGAVQAVQAVQANLDGAVATLRTMADDPAARTDVTARLRRLLAELSQDTGETAAGLVNGGLEDATPEELFSFIDQQLGATNR